MSGNNRPGHIHDDSCGCLKHSHSDHDEHYGCGDHDDKSHESHENLYADSNEIPGIYSDEIEIHLKKETKWGTFTYSLANWIEESRSWLRDSGSLIGHIKIFAAGTNGKSLWLATTGKSLNAKYSPELNNCENENLDSCKLSMTFIVFKIDGDKLKNKALKFLEENIGVYKA